MWYEPPVKNALDSALAAEKLHPEIKLYMKGQTHPTVERKIGEYKSNKRSNAFMKDKETACESAILSALIALQERAISEGGNGVIDIYSLTDYRRYESTDLQLPGRKHDSQHGPDGNGRQVGVKAPSRTRHPFQSMLIEPTLEVEPSPIATLRVVLIAALLETEPSTLASLRVTEPMLAVAPSPIATLADLATAASLSTLPLTLPPSMVTVPILAVAPLPRATLADLAILA
jgi:hypothetical protein